MKIEKHFIVMLTLDLPDVVCDTFLEHEGALNDLNDRLATIMQEELSRHNSYLDKELVVEIGVEPDNVGGI